MTHDLPEKDLPENITDKIESICEQGCAQINQLLNTAENSNEIEELSEFSQSELKQIINELEDIMSIYENSNAPAEK